MGVEFENPDGMIIRAACQKPVSPSQLGHRFGVTEFVSHSDQLL